METSDVDRQNDPACWNRRWLDDLEKRPHTGLVNPFYPTDGRDTLYEPYERLASTGTVGDYLAACERVAKPGGAADLPDDFGAYLSQRVAEPFDHLLTMSPDTRLDRCGRPLA